MQAMLSIYSLQVKTVMKTRERIMWWQCNIFQCFVRLFHLFDDCPLSLCGRVKSMLCFSEQSEKKIEMLQFAISLQMSYNLPPLPWVQDTKLDTGFQAKSGPTVYAIIILLLLVSLLSSAPLKPVSFTTCSAIPILMWSFPLPTVPYTATKVAFGWAASWPARFQSTSVNFLCPWIEWTSKQSIPLHLEGPSPTGRRSLASNPPTWCPHRWAQACQTPT